MDLLTCTATQLIRLLRKKYISSEELTQFYLQRIERYDGIGGLNTIAEINEQALRHAREFDNTPVNKRGVLFGLPLLIKDNIDVQAMHTTAGSVALADNIVENDAPVITNLKRNGALILGKTNMTEFANYTAQGMPNGFSSYGGQVRNAYDRKKDPSGSSTGSAVAVAAAFCAAAIGTDTSFSIVGCATENGVVGYKPPHGLLSGKGIIPISHSLDSAGTLTRNAEDAILIYSAMRGKALPAIKPLRPSELRLAVNTYHREQASETQLSKYEAFLMAFAEDGGNPPTEISNPYTPHQRSIMRCEFRHDLEEYLLNANAKRKTLIDIVNFYEENPEYMPFGISMLQEAHHNASGRLDDAEYTLAVKERDSLRARLSDELRHFDAVLMTGPTNVMHFVGFPSIALTLGMSRNNRHPHGMILYGADEQRLLSAALTLERYCDTVQRPNLL